jgi:predicted ATPase
VQSHAEDFGTPVVGCLCYQALCELHFGEIASSDATLSEAISLAKELNDMSALGFALWHAGCLAHLKSDPSEVERCLSDLIELSTHHNFVNFVPLATVLRGWARSASGDSAEGTPGIEQGTRDLRATGTVPGLPYYLALKAEAVYLVDRTSEALEAINEGEALAERLSSVWCFPDCTGIAVCFSRLLVLRRPKLRLRFAKPSESPGSRSRLCWRNVPKAPTPNTAAKK